jgi:hypothetical protein
LGQQLCHAWQHSRAWGNAGGLCCQRLDRIDNGDNLHEITTDQGLETMLANPPNAQEAEAWARGWCKDRSACPLELVCVMHS